MCSGGIINGAKKPKIFDPQVVKIVQIIFLNIIYMKFL
jgi:hypothetical protein